MKTWRSFISLSKNDIYAQICTENHQEAKNIEISHGNRSWFRFRVSEH